MYTMRGVVSQKHNEKVSVLQASVTGWTLNIPTGHKTPEKPIEGRAEEEN